ncbi:MAG: S1 RNA-binding domain-containing protein [Dehalococcoidia bacterium]|nr:S1 RNA-binding domain-containing protein [Dehalococcoidia bacterium]
MGNPPAALRKRRDLRSPGHWQQPRRHPRQHRWRQRPRPAFQVDSVRRDSPDAQAELANLVGQGIRLKVLELNRKRNRVILSERAAMAEWRKEQKDQILDQLQEGEIRTGVVSSITDFGVFVDLGGADGLAHMTELTWERGKKARDLYSVGDEVQAYAAQGRHGKPARSPAPRACARPERWGRGLVGRCVHWPDASLAASPS